MECLPKEVAMKLCYTPPEFAEVFGPMIRAAFPYDAQTLVVRLWSGDLMSFDVVRGLLCLGGVSV